MLVNLTGSPGSGKTTLAQCFIQKHPEYKLLSIDEYRIKYQGEVAAWVNLIKDALESKYRIVESSGLSVWLKALLEDPRIPEYEIFTIVLHGNNQVFEDRIVHRDKVAPELPYKGLSLVRLICLCEEKLPGIYPSARFIITGNSYSGSILHGEGQAIESLSEYQHFEKAILERQNKIEKALQLEQFTVTK